MAKFVVYTAYTHVNELKYTCAKMLIRGYSPHLRNMTRAPKFGVFRVVTKLGKKLTPYNIIKLNKKSNIWFTHKHISTLGSNNTICCDTVQIRGHKMVTFLFLEYGIFSLNLGESILLVLGT